MRRKNKADEAAKAAFLKKVAALWPVARGTVSLVRKPCSRRTCPACASGERHPALIFTCRVGGRSRCGALTRRSAHSAKCPLHFTDRLQFSACGEGLGYGMILPCENVVGAK